jgi:hypothetical protein
MGCIRSTNGIHKIIKDGRAKYTTSLINSHKFNGHSNGEKKKLENNHKYIFFSYINEIRKSKTSKRVCQSFFHDFILTPDVLFKDQARVIRLVCTHCKVLVW